MYRTHWLALFGILLAGCAIPLEPEDSGIGFVIKPTDFGDPCTDNAGDFPVIYDNHSANTVDVSFKIVNTGGSNVFVVATGFVIPPLGPGQRPRIIRLTLAPDENIKLRGQAEDCAWTATVRPH